MFKSKRNTVLAFLILTCMFLLVAGCSEDDDDGVSAQQGELSCTLVSPANGETIVIGNTVEIELCVECYCDTVTCVTTWLNDDILKYDHTDPYISYWNTENYEAGTYTIKVTTETGSSKFLREEIVVELVTP